MALTAAVLPRRLQCRRAGLHAVVGQLLRKGAHELLAAVSPQPLRHTGPAGPASTESSEHLLRGRYAKRRSKIGHDLVTRAFADEVQHVVRCSCDVVDREHIRADLNVEREVVRKTSRARVLGLHRVRTSLATEVFRPLEDLRLCAGSTKHAYHACLRQVAHVHVELLDLLANVRGDLVPAGLPVLLLRRCCWLLFWYWWLLWRWWYRISFSFGSWRCRFGWSRYWWYFAWCLAVEATPPKGSYRQRAAGPYLRRESLLSTLVDKHLLSDGIGHELVQLVRPFGCLGSPHSA